jgi:hypothetical protein
MYTLLTLLMSDKEELQRCWILCYSNNSNTSIRHTKPASIAVSETSTRINTHQNSPTSLNGRPVVTQPNISCPIRAVVKDYQHNPI